MGRNWRFGSASHPTSTARTGPPWNTNRDGAGVAVRCSFCRALADWLFLSFDRLSTTWGLGSDCSSPFQDRAEFRRRPAGRKPANCVTSMIYEDLRGSDPQVATRSIGFALEQDRWRTGDLQTLGRWRNRASLQNDFGPRMPGGTSWRIVRGSPRYMGLYPRQDMSSAIGRGAGNLSGWGLEVDRRPRSETRSRRCVLVRGRPPGEQPHERNAARA